MKIYLYSINEWALKVACEKNEIVNHFEGADPEFFNMGFKFTKGGSVWSIYPTFVKIPNENEIIWTQKGFEQNPANPLWISHWFCKMWR